MQISAQKTVTLLLIIALGCFSLQWLIAHPSLTYGDGPTPALHTQQKPCNQQQQSASQLCKTKSTNCFQAYLLADEPLTLALTLMATLLFISTRKYRPSPINAIYKPPKKPYRYC